MGSIARRSLLGAAASLACLPARAQSGSAPIRIGCITALSGPQEVLGRPILTGALIAADQINATGGVLGRPLEIVEGNAHADPERAVELANEMAQAGINLLCGCVTSDLALAVTARLEPLNSVLITCSAQSDKLTHEAFNPHYFRVTDQTYMRNRAQARLLAERYPEVLRWGSILPDSEYGRSSWAAFRDGLLEAYPAIAKQEPVLDTPVLARFGETDFHAQIAALRKKGAEGLFIAVYGDDAISFYQQAKRSGFFKQVKVLADSFNEFLVPLELGSSTPEHLWLAMNWYYGGYASLPMSRQLYDDNLRRTGNALPMGLLSAGHSAVYAYAAAIGKGKATDSASVIGGLSGLTIDTAKGRITFRPEDHQAICDVNFVRIKASTAEPTMDMIDYARPDIEVAEFIRYDGSSVIEPPSPGKALVHRG